MSPGCRRRLSEVRLSIFFLLLILFAAQTFAQGAPARRIVPGDVANEYIVSLQNVPREQVDTVAKQIARKVDGQLIAVWKHAVTAFWIRVPDTRAAELYKDRRVKSVEQNARVYASATQVTGSTCNRSTDPPSACVQPSPAGQFPTELQPHPLWHLSRISHRVIEATPEYRTYTYAHAGGGVTAYVIDGGVLRFHQEFEPAGTKAEGRHIDPALSAGRIREEPGANVIASDPLPASAPHYACVVDPFGPTLGGYRYHSDYPWFTVIVGDLGITDHGTGVASILGGRIVGVAKDVTIIPVKALGCGFRQTTADMISALNWVRAREAEIQPRQKAVVSMSTFRTVSSEAASEILALEQAIDSLTNYGIPVVASANNQNNDACRGTPARMSRRGGRGKVITVGGLAKNNDIRYGTSNAGPCVDILAPAELMPAASSNGWASYREGSNSGTSYSAPTVAGIIARMMSEDPTLTADLNTTPGVVVDRIADRLVAAATALPEPNGADGTQPLGRNSPNKIAYHGAISISQQPQSVNLTSAGASSATLQVSTPPASPACQWQWYVSTSNSYAASEEIAGAISSTYTATVASNERRKWYWVRVHGCNSVGFVDSAMAAVSRDCPLILSQPRSVGPGANPQLSIVVAPTDSPLTVQWYRGPRGKMAPVDRRDTDYSVPVGTNSTTLALTAADLNVSENPEFWARVEAGGCRTDSDAAHVWHCPPLTPPNPTALNAKAEPSSANPAYLRITFVDPSVLPNGIELYELERLEGTSWVVVQTSTDPDTRANGFSVSGSAAATYRIRIRNSCFSEVSTEVATAELSGCTANNFARDAPIVMTASVPAGSNVRVTQNILPPRSQAEYRWIVRDLNGNFLYRLQTATNVLDDRPTTHVKYSAEVLYCGMQLETTGAVVLIQPNVDLPASEQTISCGTKTSLTATVTTVGTLPVTKTWYRVIAGSTIEQVPDSDPTDDSLRDIGAGTYFLRAQVTMFGYTAYRDSRFATIVEVVRRPRRRAVSSGGGGSNPTNVIPAGSALTLSVEDDKDGTTFEWFEGASYTDESKRVGTTATVIVTPLQSTSYWAKMTQACGTSSASETTDFFPVQVQCAPAIHEQPQSATMTMTAPGTTMTGLVSVVAAGSGPFTYRWYELDTNGQRTLVGTNAASHTWEYVVPASQPASVQKRWQVEVTTKCNDQWVTAQSDVATISIVASTPQRVYAYNSGESLYGPGRTARLFVYMLPDPSPEHVYTYEWFQEDGSATGRKLATTASELTTSTTSIATYWCRITGTHTVGGVTYTEVTVSPKMYIWRYGTCELPDIKVSQTDQVVRTGMTTITFTAVCDWPKVKFQWYRGQTGDTRDPMLSESGKPNQLTVSSTVANSYWVRASLDCGAVEDSPTLTFTNGTCAPVLIDQNIASAEVAYGGTATLSVTPIDVPRPSYTWYEGATQANALPQSGPAVISLTNVTKSGRYWVRVRNLDCTNSADSYIATVRVASCPSLTPPAWQTEVWTDINTSATLNGTTGGATGYQWFEGEVGDDAHMVPGATLATFVTPSLAVDTKYWVRAFGSGCVVDSPTMTVKVCDPPHVTKPLFLTQNVPSGQRVIFHVPMAGTALTYRWYKGLSGDTSTPVGQPVDLLEIYPTETSEYWVRVTGKCGVGGASPRVYDSPTFLASVCPTVAAPTATSQTVMPGGTTTLSIVATGSRLTYQWYQGQAGDRSTPVPNGSGATVTTPAINAATTFWCEVTSGGCSKFSEAIPIALCSEPIAAWQHGDKAIAKGDLVTFMASATVTSGMPLYTFYKGPKGNIAASTVMTTESENYWFSAVVTETADYWFRARLGNCWADSANIKVTVCIPKIATQPAAGGITAGESYTLTVVSDITPENGYQWYTGVSGDTASPIAGATSASLTVSPTADTKYWVRVKGCGSSKADSVAALVSVCTKPVISSSTPSHWTSRGAAPRSLMVVATGTNLTYRWYRGAAGDTTTQIGTSQSVSVAPDETTNYWARVSNGCGNADTPTITVSVCAAPVITVQPISQPVFSGKSATLSVTATEATTTPMTYQWYSGTPGSGTAIAGATNPTYTTPALNAQASYYVRVSAGECWTDSDPAIISMCAYSEVINAPNDVDIAVGQTTRLSLALTPAPDAVTWYRGVQGDKTTPIGSLQYADVAPNVTTQYWAQVVQGGCTSKTRTVTVYVSIPTITTQPASTQINNGQTATLTVAATTTGITYQWYQGTSGSGTLISGANGPSHTTPPLSANTSYWVKVTGSRGHTVNSNTATVTICAPPAITTEAPSRSITKGSSTTLSIVATGTNLRYQWYNGASGNTTSPIAGATTASTTVAPTAPKSYWVRVTGDCGTRDGATVQVDVCATPVITTQPLSQSVFSGGTATLSIAATQETGLSMSYQWYSGVSPTGTVIAGATGTTYTTPALTSDANYFVKVTSGVCSEYSSTATVSMCAYPPVINAPNDSDIAVGQTVRLSVVLSPAPEQVRWYRGAVGDKTTLISSSTYADVSPTATTQYWGEYVHGGCTSKTRQVTVYVSIPTITQQPVSTIVAPNSSATLTVAANTAGVTYQWYQGTSGSGTPISGATSASYVTPVLASGSSATYWVKVTGSRGAVVNSNTATVTWCTPASITSQPLSRNISRGELTWLTVNATGTNLRYQWYRGDSGVETYPLGTGGISNGGTASSLNVGPSSTEKYWVKVTSDCGSVNSSTCVVSVCVPPTINTQPANQTVFSGASATLSVSASSGTELPLSYQWFDGGTLQPVSGATAATFTTPPLTAEKQYFVRVYSGSCMTESQFVTVSMCVYPATTNSPDDGFIYSGQATTLYVPMSPVPESVTWYAGASGNRSAPISYQSQVTVYPTVTSQYWGEFTNGGCSSIGRTVTITVCVPKITTQPASATIARNGTKTLSVVAKDAVTYQWYTGTSSGRGTAISGATSSTYTTPPLTTTTGYWVRVTGSCSKSVDSSLATVAVQ